ncbi:MAG TPA: Calx-beta domain-containing protein, partial [Candidatus Sulfotelmatobacter sp.]|nr:Calx-beta domain-containing protein [Candidatus Sulfotelmatobacter sp.]
VDTAPGQFIFSQTNYVVGEGDGNAIISVVRTNGRAGVVSVAFNTLPGSATPGLKYLSTNGVLTFADNEIVKRFAVRILEETQVEGAQNLAIALSNPTGGSSIVGTNPVTLTILDDDLGVSFASYVSIASETNGLVTLDVLRMNNTNVTTQVSYATTNGTATAGLNYVTTSGTLTFKPGESRKSISISLLYDARVTGDLTFGVGLFNPTSGAQLAVPSSANVVILDVDSGLRFLDTNAVTGLTVTNTVLENGTNVVITVMRTNANTGPVQVNYSTADDTAVAPIDYIAASGTLTFTNGQLSNSFTVPIIDNVMVDGNKSFTISLFNPRAPAQLLTPSQARINIIDNDSGFRFSSGTYEILENGVAAVVTVERIGNTNSSSTVNYSTQNGTAISGIDYLPASGVLTFTNGETSKTFSVPVIDDTLIQGDRTVLLALANASGNATLVAPSAASLTIHDNDGSLVVPAGSAMTSENYSPANGVIEPGETVTLLFAFRNTAGSNTVNMVATLLATNGVSSPSAPQSYGTLVVD